MKHGKFCVLVVMCAAVWVGVAWAGPFDRVVGAVVGGKGPGRAPTFYVNLATEHFLRAGVVLHEAAGHKEEAEKRRAVIKKLESGQGLKGAKDFGNLDQLADADKKIAQDTAALDKMSDDDLRHAAVELGVATFFEAKAAEAVKNVAGGSLNPAAVAETAVLARYVPTNLKSMMGVQAPLFAYVVKSRKIKVDEAIKEKAANLEKR